MSNKKSLLDHLCGAAFLLSFISAGLFLAIYYRYEGLQSDAIAYFGIAQKYAAGNFKDAVNGFWSPMFSWLLIPFIRAGYQMLYSARIINLVAGVFLLFGLKALLTRFDLDGRIKDLLLYAGGIIVLSYITPIFPDLILLSILVWYLYFIFDRGYSLSSYNGLICGVLGAFGYFSKNYAFPFFISHFILLNIFYYFRAGSVAEKRNIFKNAVIGLISFLLISGIWISMISSKYGHFAIGTAGSYNFSQIGPDLPLMSEQPEPVLYKGLMEPPNNSAISIMEDPTYMEVDNWSIIDSWRNLFHFVKHVIKNIIAEVRIFQGFSVFSLPIILSAVFILIRQRFEDIGLLLPLATLVLYSAGYTPFIIDQNNIRYLWIDNILLLLMGGQLLTMFFQRVRIKNRVLINILIFALLVSFVLSPVFEILKKPDRGEKIFNLYKSISAESSIQGNVASNDRWGDSLQLSFYFNSNEPTRYLGIPKKGNDEEKLMDEIKAFGVDYFMVWGESDIFQGYENVIGEKISGFKIYSLKNIDHMSNKTYHGR